MVPLLDATLLADLYDVRAALQSVQARRAAERADDADIAALAAARQAYDAAVTRQDPEAALACNEAFHGAINAAARNSQATQLFRSRSAFVNTARYRLGFGPGRMEVAGRQHGLILDAIAARDPDAAAKTAFEHSMAARDDLLARFAQGFPG